MTDIGSTRARTSYWRRLAVPAAAVLLLLVTASPDGPAGPPAIAAAADRAELAAYTTHHAHGYTRTARARATVSVTATARATESVTVSVTAGNPPMTATATGTATASARAGAKASATAKAKGRGRTKKAARRSARRHARSAARKAATKRARDLAHRRAMDAARGRARSAAKSQATARAEQDALARSAAAAASRAAAETPQPAPAQPCGGPMTTATGDTYVCTFDDEFTGTAVDSTKWQPITSDLNGQTDGLACYVNSPNNIAVSGGTLNLTVRKEAAPFPCTKKLTTQYTGGQLATYRKWWQTYGRFAIRAKFPPVMVQGAQTSLWLWPENNILTGLTGEIDVAEWYSVRWQYAVPTIHYQFLPETVSLLTGTNVTTNYNCTIGDLNAFHTYGLEWTKQRMTITIDNQVCLINNYSVLGISPFDQPFFIALSACLGQTNNNFDPARTPLPATSEIDWVRAWKLAN